MEKERKETDFLEINSLRKIVQFEKNGKRKNNELESKAKNTRYDAV